MEAKTAFFSSIQGMELFSSDSKPRHPFPRHRISADMNSTTGSTEVAFGTEDSPRLQLL